MEKTAQKPARAPRNRKIEADALNGAGVVMVDLMAGGRRVLKVGDTVTPANPGAPIFKGWSELTVEKIEIAAGVPVIHWKAQDGKTKGTATVASIIATTSSELQARAQLADIREKVAELKKHEDRASDLQERQWEEAEQAILQDPLTVEVREDWHAVGATDESGKPAEWRILLCTGGPAVQIVGEFDANQEPEKPRLQHQDWFTPWTDTPLTADEIADVLTYARCFYWGE